MIIQSPESAMPEPYKTYVRQRSEMIANILQTIVGNSNVQLCPRAVLPAEVLYDGEGDILYGAVVEKETDGHKSVLYEPVFNKNKKMGLATGDIVEAKEYAAYQFEIGNRVRVKDPVESDGKGQTTVDSLVELEKAFEETTYSGENRAVIMPHLETIIHRISVGRIALGEVGTFLYFGQEVAQTHEDEMVYGGTTLGLFRDDFIDGILQVQDKLGIPSDLARLGMKAINAYQSISLKAGRVSVDVIEGLTDNSSVFRDVVDLTPRVGGTTPAEVLAMKEVYKKPEAVCLAKSQLIYNPEASPSTGINFIDTDTLVINAQVLEVI